MTGPTNFYNIFYVLIFALYSFVTGNIPAFDAFNVIEQVIFLPKDIAIGTPVYRFRTSDQACQGKLTFGTKDGRQESDVIKMIPVEDCSCVCDVDAILLKELSAGKIYNITVFVKDSAGQSGETTFRINVTDTRSNPKIVFSDYNSTIRVSEATPVNATLGYVLAKNYFNGYYRLVDLKLKGSDTFRLFQRAESEDIMRGSIILASPLDYEVKTFYEIAIVAYNGYVERPIDTRNIIGLNIFVVVLDEQDTPPMFVNLPTVVRLSNDMIKGDVLFTVSANDGDTANKRLIKYSIISDTGSSYFQFDADSNDVILVEDISTVIRETEGSPVTLTVQAEEVGGHGKTSSTTTAEVVLLMDHNDDQAPTFLNKNYVGFIEEHSPAFTLVRFDISRRVWDNDQGTSGVFTLHIEDINEDDAIDRVLEVEPSVVVNEGEFTVRVKNPALLDYERYPDGELKFLIIAQDLSEKKISSNTTITVHMIDINDNFPKFTKDNYNVTLPEDAKSGTLVVQVSAFDMDSGNNGDTIYSNLTGDHADRLLLDPNTGRITLTTSEHGFDREHQTDYHIKVSATDRGNPSKTNTTTVTIHISDVNDNAPEFREKVYETVLTSGQPQTVPFLRVEAFDLDEPDTNNSNICYEIVSGNLMNSFEIDHHTGDLRLKEPLTTDKDTLQLNQPMGINIDDVTNQDVAAYELVVRAYDFGVPTLSNTATVKIFLKSDPGYLNGTVLYVYPASMDEVDHDRDKIERFLTKLNGAPTTIQRTSVYLENSEDQVQGRVLTEKTLIRTNVRYQRQSMVNLDEVNKALPIKTISEHDVPTSKPSPTNMPSSQNAPDINKVPLPTEELNAGTSYGWKVALITILVVFCLVLIVLLGFCAYRQTRKMDDRKFKSDLPKSGESDINVTSDKQELVKKKQTSEDLVGPYDQAALRRDDQRRPVVDPTPLDGDRESVSSNKRRDNLQRSGGSQKLRTRTPIPYSRHLVNSEAQTSQDFTDGNRGNSTREQKFESKPLTRQTPTKENSIAENPSSQPKASDESDVRVRVGTNPNGEQFEDLNDTRGSNPVGARVSRNPLMDKRSMFTIAYQGMQNNQDALKDRETSFD